MLEDVCVCNRAATRVQIYLSMSRVDLARWGCHGGLLSFENFCLKERSKADAIDR